MTGPVTATPAELYRPAPGADTLPCGCTARGIRQVDVARHKAFHQLAQEQGGPLHLGDYRGHPLSRTVVDDRAEASGKRSPGWRRKAHHGSPE